MRYFALVNVCWSSIFIDNFISFEEKIIPKQNDQICSAARVNKVTRTYSVTSLVDPTELLPLLFSTTLTAKQASHLLVVGFQM